MKKTLDFSLSYPLIQKVVRDLKIVSETIGELTLTGTAYMDPTVPQIEVEDRYTVDIDFVRHEGHDIKAVLEVTGGMEEIEAYCIRKVARMFEAEETELENDLYERREAV
jgi:hypothetical protein